MLLTVKVEVTVKDDTVAIIIAVNKIDNILINSFLNEQKNHTSLRLIFNLIGNRL
jgi:hypothetical protein